MSNRMIYVLTMMGKCTKRIDVLATGHSVEILKQYCKKHMFGETLFWETPLQGQHDEKVVTWADHGKMYEYQISKSIMLIGGTLIRKGASHAKAS